MDVYEVMQILGGWSEFSSQNRHGLKKECGLIYAHTFMRIEFSYASHTHRSTRMHRLTR